MVSQNMIRKTPLKDLWVRLWHVLLNDFESIKKKKTNFERSIFVRISLVCSPY